MEAREDWFEGQLDLDPEGVVFLDETATATDMAPCYGRAAARPLQDHHGHGRPAGERPFRGLMDGATNGARFGAYLSDVPVPALNPRRGGDGQPERPQALPAGLQPRLQPDRERLLNQPDRKQL